MPWYLGTQTQFPVPLSHYLLLGLTMSFLSKCIYNYLCFPVDPHVNIYSFYIHFHFILIPYMGGIPYSNLCNPLPDAYDFSASAVSGQEYVFPCIKDTIVI